jgi:hypothetical protein
MKKISLFVLIIFLISPKVDAQKEIDKNKAFNIFLNELTAALRTRDIKKVSNYVMSDRNALEDIKYRLKNQVQLQELLTALKEKYVLSDDEWERVINFNSKTEYMSIYFSFKNGLWKVAEIATAPYD